MATYVWTAKDLTGQSVVKEVQAETSAEAQASLLAEGYTDLILKEDDIMAIARAGFDRKPTVFGEEITVTAKDRLKHMDDPTVTFGDALRKGIARSIGPFLLLILFIGYSCYRANWWTAGLLAFSLIAWLIFITCASLPSIYYKKLIQAADWNRWNEVLSLIKTLGTFGRFGLIKVPATELTRYRAKSLIGLGQLEEGLAVFRPCEGRPDCPRWLYLLFMAGLYDTAKRHDLAIEYNLRSIAEKSSPTAWVDLAYRYAKYKCDPAKAREALAKSDAGPIPEIARPFRIRCVGVIAYRESDYETARRELETAIAMVEKNRGRPFRDGHLSVARGFLACVLAKQGDFVAAKTNFTMAKDYLVATQEDGLLAEIRQVVGEIP